MEQEDFILHNKQKAFSGCDVGQGKQHHRTLECLDNFAKTIGIDLRTAIEMGFIKNPTEAEIKHSKGIE